MNNSIVTLILLLLILPVSGYAQEGATNEPHYEVNKIYPPFSISKEKLREATSLTDLNKRYPTSWIREYISVEILTTHKGKLIKAMSKNEILSREQKDLMKTADPGAGISVLVRYIPENTLKDNEPKEIDFTLSVNPETDASYPGGSQQLQQYLQREAVDKIPDATFRNYDLTAIKFTVDEAGNVINSQVFWPSKHEKIDELLLNAICNMPKWEPAAYTNGPKIKQEFVLTVGNMKNCAVNLLNIRRSLTNIE